MMNVRKEPTSRSVPPIEILSVRPLMLCSRKILNPSINWSIFYRRMVISISQENSLRWRGRIKTLYPFPSSGRRIFHWRIGCRYRRKWRTLQYVSWQKHNRYRQQADALVNYVKADEVRLQKIAVLKTHILNFPKPCQPSIVYKVSGNSKKFFEEHRDMLTLRRAAKRLSMNTSLLIRIRSHFPMWRSWMQGMLRFCPARKRVTRATQIFEKKTRNGRSPRVLLLLSWGRKPARKRNSAGSRIRKNHIKE